MKDTLMIKPLCEDFICPKYETSNSAGFDLRAHFNTKLNGKKVTTKIVENVIDGVREYSHLNESSSITINPGMFAVIPLGFSCQLPEGYELQVRPRSGLAAKFGISVVNSPGTVDADYRGAVCVILINHGGSPFTVNNGDRICQGVISEVPQVNFMLVDELTETDRGEGGFGHSGIR